MYNACMRHHLCYPSSPNTRISLGNSERYRRLASGHSNLPPCRLGETTSFLTAYFPSTFRRSPLLHSLQSGKSASVPFTSESYALIFQSRFHVWTFAHLTSPVYLIRALFRESKASEQGTLTSTTFSLLQTRSAKSRVIIPRVLPRICLEHERAEVTKNCRKITPGEKKRSDPFHAHFSLSLYCLDSPHDSTIHNKRVILIE